jgi:hypothetical protein
MCHCFEAGFHGKSSWLLLTTTGSLEGRVMLRGATIIIVAIVLVVVAWKLMLAFMIFQ